MVDVGGHQHMSRKTLRVADLAREAESDLDETLVALWDAGLEDVAAPNDLIPKNQISAARAALGLLGAREQGNVQYWIDVSGLSSEQLAERMSTVGVKLDQRARRIPKNSLRRFRQMFATDEARREVVAPARDEPQPLVGPFEWKEIGKVPVSKYLSEAELIGIHVTLEQDFRDSGDPISPPGVKDPNLVSMSAHRPLTSFGQTLKYPTAEMAGAALFHSVALNHGFHNGNKRTALVALIAFLDANGLVLTCTQEEPFRITLRVAQHGLVPVASSELSDREVANLAEWVRKHTRSIDRSDRALKWIKLKQLLTGSTSVGRSRAEVCCGVHVRKLCRYRWLAQAMEPRPLATRFTTSDGNSNSIQSTTSNRRSSITVPKSMPSSANIATS